MRWAVKNSNRNGGRRAWTGWGGTIIFVLILELLEELIEESIAFGIAFFISKAISTVFLVAVTHVGLIVIKKVVKDITYKEGTDKMDKIKTFFKGIFANKKTIFGSLTAVVTSALAVLGGTGVIDLSALPELNVEGFNITPIVFYGLLLAGSLLGILGKGPESIAEFQDRIAEKDATKEAKAILKNEKKEQKQLEKLVEIETKELEKEKLEQEKIAEEKRLQHLKDVARRRALENLRAKKQEQENQDKGQ